MAFHSDLPDLAADLAALPQAELTELFATAYAGRDRAEFLRLGQRLAREVALSLRGGRMQSLQEELYSEGLLALVQRFDRTTRPIEHPYWYFRTAVRRAILAWARQQKIIRRKGAKHRDVLLDADVSADGDFDSTVVESAAVAPADNELTTAIYAAAQDRTDDKILLGIQSGLSSANIADALGLSQLAVDQRIDAMRGRVGAVSDSAAGLKLAASIARATSAPICEVVDVQGFDSPAQLRALGFTYPAIAARLGMKYLDVFWTCNPDKRTGYGRNPKRKTRRKAMAG